MTLLIFLATYCVVTLGSRFTALGEYRWFNNLEQWLLYKYPKREQLIRAFFSFKLFHCTPCRSFWLSIPIFSYFFVEPINIILALLLYLLKQTNNTENGITNNED